MKLKNRTDTFLISGISNTSVLMALMAASFMACGYINGNQEGPAEPLDEEEMMRLAYEELLEAEGKADAALCSGVVPPDRGPFNMKIALTFDDGPSLSTTPKVLEVLRKHDAPGLFFINGRQVVSSRHMELLHEIVADGHLLGNHTQNHVNARSVSLSTLAREIQDTDDLLRELLSGYDQEPVYFRFPFGSSNCSTYDLAVQYGYRVVGWHIDTADWCFQSPVDGRGYCSPRTFAHVPDSFRNDYAGYTLHQARRNRGGILLMHDIHSFTANHLDELLTRLTDEGYVFTALDDFDTFPLLNEVEVPDPSWIGDPCSSDEECEYMPGRTDGFCYLFEDFETLQTNGFCSVPCDGYCPDLTGKALTFCVESDEPETGICISRASAINSFCEDIPGTIEETAHRFVHSSGAPDTIATACIPNEDWRF